MAVAKVYIPEGTLTLDQRRLRPLGQYRHRLYTHLATLDVCSVLLRDGNALLL
jgi:hypothetical protein